MYPQTLIGIPLIVATLVVSVLNICLLLRMKNLWWIAALSIINLALLMAEFVALQVGSNVIAGAGIGRLFLIVLLPVGIPVAVGVGFVVAALIQLLLRSKPKRPPLPWAIAIVIAMVFVAIQIPSRTSSAIYREFVGQPLPAGISDLQCWWAMLPGDQLYAMRFNLDPAQFSKLLSVQSFQEVTDAWEIQHAKEEYFPANGSRRFPGLLFEPPKMKIARMYVYEQIDSNSLPHTMKIFTNDAKNTVLIIGDN